jgi:hypothetical protein
MWIILKFKGYTRVIVESDNTLTMAINCNSAALK